MQVGQEHRVNGTAINAIVVDDNKDLLNVFVELLQFRGVNILGTGSNGEEAFLLYQSHRPDIVFLDAAMPGYDGFYAINKIKEFDADAKVVLVTGAHHEKAMLHNCRADVIVEKPMDIEDIMRIAKNLTIAKEI